MPVLYIITGSNGAGKSSVGPEYIPIHLRATIFDGDKLFMEKRSEFWRSGIRSHKECKKLAAQFVDKKFDELVADALDRKTDFAYEGHFTNDATWDIPKKFLSAGFDIHLIFFGLTDAILSEARVVARSKEGGHYVDPLTISSNFFGNLEKLDTYFKMFHSVTIVDTSTPNHKVLAVLNKGVPSSSVPLSELPEWFTNNLKGISALLLE